MDHDQSETYGTETTPEAREGMPVPAADRAASGVPERDSLDPRDLLTRLAALSPVPDALDIVSVRTELLTGADELRQRLHGWRALAAAARTPNPWLEPASVLSYLELKALGTGQLGGPPPEFVVLWRDLAATDHRRDRQMIALVPFRRTGRRASEPWCPPGGLATPLIRHHMHRVALAAIARWQQDDAAAPKVLTLADDEPHGGWQTGPGEPVRGEALARAEAEAERATIGGWHELAALGERRLPALDPETDVDVFDARFVTAADVADAMAYELVWRSRGSADGTYEIGGEMDLRFAHFTRAAAERRLFIGRGRTNDRVRAIAIALKSGPDVVLARLSSDPGLGEDHRRGLMRRVIKGLSSALAGTPGVVRLRTGPYAASETVAGLFPDRLDRETLTFTARGPLSTAWSRMLRRA